MPRLLVDLPTDALVKVLALSAPRDIASALCSCRALGLIDPWRAAFEARWGASGLEVHASVGRHAYLLRHVCELVSGSSALATARHDACLHGLEAVERPMFGSEYFMESDDDDESGSSKGGGPIDSSRKLRQGHTAHRPDRSRARVLRDVERALAQAAVSAASARAVMQALKDGLYILIDRANSVDDQRGAAWHNSWRLKRFVLASPRGDLVAFYSKNVATVDDPTHPDARLVRTWELRATVIGVADEPQLSEAMSGSQRLRGQDLLGWFDRLLLNGDPLVQSTRLRTPPKGFGELQSLISCEASAEAGGGTICQQIAPDPSPAVVGALLTSLGLDKGAAHANDLLLALLVISNMVPAEKVGDWRAPPGEGTPGEDFEDEYQEAERLVWEQPGICMWRSNNEPRYGVWPWSEKPTRITWASLTS